MSIAPKLNGAGRIVVDIILKTFCLVIKKEEPFIKVYHNLQEFFCKVLMFTYIWEQIITSFGQFSSEIK